MGEQHTRASTKVGTRAVLAYAMKPWLGAVAAAAVQYWRVYSEVADSYGEYAEQAHLDFWNRVLAVAMMTGIAAGVGLFSSLLFGCIVGVRMRRRHPTNPWRHQWMTRWMCGAAFALY